VTCLIVAEIDVCVLANNHVLDYGPLGLVETLETLGRAGLTGLGGGSAAAARLADVAGWGFLMFFASGEHSTRSVPMCSRHSPNALLFGCLTLVNGVFAVEKGEFVIAGLLMAGGFIAFYVLALSGDQISRRDGLLLTWCTVLSHCSRSGTWSAPLDATDRTSRTYLSPHARRHGQRAGGVSRHRRDRRIATVDHRSREHAGVPWPANTQVVGLVAADVASRCGDPLDATTATGSAWRAMRGAP
jgi:capsule synthesis protein PGA_cap